MSINITGTIQKFAIFCIAGSFLLVSIVMAQGTATYDLTFTATWSSSTHPTDIPSNPHFSGMIGGTHNSAVSFWNTGGIASDGIKDMAELGSKGPLRGEVRQAISALNADAIVEGSVMNSPDSQTITFDIRPPWNLVTVTSMVAPSPDWFVGVSGLDLLDSDGNWINSLVVDLFVYDAGTDSGPSYTSPDQPTIPREPISRITGYPFLVDGSVKPVGTFRFELQSVVGNTPRVSLSVDQNPVVEGESVTATVQMSSALNADVVIPITLSPGTAESDDYNSTTPVNLTIDSGATEAEYTIQTYRDNDIEDETFTVELDVANLPSEVVEGSPVSEEVTIRDLDAAASLSVDQNPVDEGESVTVTVRLSSALNTDVAIPVTLSPGTAESSDYDDTSPVNLNINSGATEAELTIQTYRDDDIEDETFTVELDSTNLPTGVLYGSPASEEVTIRDLDAAASLSVDQNPVNEGESITVTVQLSNALNTDVAIPLTISPGTAESSDYDSTSPINLNISSGATEAEYTIQTYRDNDIEDETFTVELDSTNLPSGVIASSPISEEVTITDLDMPGISTPTSVELMEGEMTSIHVSLTTQPSSDVTVTLTGHENTDLMLDLNVLTFTTSNWNQEQTVTLTATEDTDLLNDEVTLTFSASGSGYMVSHTLTVTIQDNLGVGTEQTEQAVSLALWGNYPNPVSNSTKIAFDLPEPAQISVAITDLLGRTVKTLPDKSFGVGTGHTVQINTGDLPSGVYFYTLKIVMDDKVVRRSKAMSVVR
ncbi:MAG: spondin domain-containing protein [Bacteroidota bacterium]|nr:spondin domain-containing protein [Bacteroidota bacterium]